MKAVKHFPTLLCLALWLGLFLLPTTLSAQQRVGGYVVDSKSGERLSYVKFYVAAGRGTLSNFNGDYMLDVAPDDSIVITHIGYERMCVKAADLPRVVRLRPMAILMSEVVVQPINADAILKKVIRRLKKEHEKHGAEMSAYFMRLAYWDSFGKELVEAFTDAFSAVNINRLSINSGIKSLDEASDERHREIKATNVHQILEAGPMTFDSHTWDLKKVPLNNYEQVKELYDISALRMKGDDGQALYRIDMKFKGDWPEVKEKKTDPKKPQSFWSSLLGDISSNRPKYHPPLLEGTIYVRQKDYALMRFDGDVLNQLMKVDGQLDTTKLDIHIQYEHERGFTEVSHIAANGQHPKMHFHALLFNLHSKVDSRIGIIASGNLLNAVQEAGYDSELWKEYDIIRRTEEEEKIAFGRKDGDDTPPLPDANTNN